MKDNWCYQVAGQVGFNQSLGFYGPRILDSLPEELKRANREYRSEVKDKS